MANSFWSKLNPLKWGKEIVLNYIVRTIFERIPVISRVLSYLNGRKEQVGKVIWSIALVIRAVQTQFPDAIPVEISDADIAFVIGFTLDLLGQAHAYDKARRDLPRKPEATIKADEILTKTNE